MRGSLACDSRLFDLDRFFGAVGPCQTGLGLEPRRHGFVWNEAVAGDSWDKRPTDVKPQYPTLPKHETPRFYGPISGPRKAKGPHPEDATPRGRTRTSDHPVNSGFPVETRPN